MFLEETSQINHQLTLSHIIKESIIDSSQLFIQKRDSIRSLLIKNNRKYSLFLNKNKQKQQSTPYSIIKSEVFTSKSCPLNEYTQPKGIFVFPTNANYRSEDKYSIDYMVHINSFQDFYNILNKVKPRFDEDYFEYPHDKQQEEIIQNENMIILMFVTCFQKINLNPILKNSLGFGREFGLMNEVIEEISVLIDKALNVVYKLIYNFIFENRKKGISIFRQALEKEGESNKHKDLLSNLEENQENLKGNNKQMNNNISKLNSYRNSFCNICYRYGCNIHFYRKFEKVMTSKVKLFRPYFEKASLKKEYYNVYEFIEEGITEGDILNNKRIEDSDLKRLIGYIRLNDIRQYNLYTCKENHDCIREVHQKTYENDCIVNDEPENQGVVSVLYSKIKDFIVKFNNPDSFYILCLMVLKLNISSSCLLSQLYAFDLVTCKESDFIIKTFQDPSSLKVINYIYENEVYSQVLNNNYLKLGFIGDFLPENRIYIDSYKYIYPSAGILPKKKNNNQQSNLNHIDYIPCNHKGICTIDNCDCIKIRGYCEKFCNCSFFCESIFKGCECKNNCLFNCKCNNESRLCDSDICYECKDNKKICSNFIPNIVTFYSVNEGQSKKLYLGKSSICDSFGIFTLEDIEEGEFICEYNGELLNKDETERRSVFNDHLGLNYLFQLSSTLDIDAYRIGNEMRYINHSSFGFQNSVGRTIFNKNQNRIFLFALRKIVKYEELFFDYQIKVNVPWLYRYNKIYIGCKK